MVTIALREAPKPMSGWLPGIQFELDLKPDHEASIYVLGYRAQVDVCGVLLPSEGYIPWGRSISQRQDGSLTVRIPVMRHIYEAIERNRRHGDAPFSVNLQVVHVPPDQPWTPATYRTDSAHVGQRSFSQKEWASIASAWRYDDFAVIELPRPSLPALADFARVSQRVEQAAVHLRDGQDEEAVADCRHAWEALDRLLPKGSPLAAQVAATLDHGSPGTPDKPTKSDRIKQLRGVAENLFHIGHHEGYHVSHDDARFCVHLMTAIAAYHGVALSKIAAGAK
ncbi:MAG: hypothetical protein ACYC2H_08495 [Thermoplasmatota archaeon]